MTATRIFLLCEAAGFAVASAVHAGAIFPGYAHANARIAESVIAAVLIIGLLVSYAGPPWDRRAGIGAQAFALVGTLVGLFTIAVGVGPRTVPDIIYHVAVVAVLVAGIRVATREASGGAARDATRAAG